MKMRSYFTFILIASTLFFATHVKGQSISLLSEGTKSSFRGLSVVSNEVIWVSGSNGTIGRSVNGGIQWQFIKVNGYETTDFRDIEAFDSLHALIMGIDCPARILSTKDGGKSWELVFEDTTKGMFLDAMSFDKKGKRGVVVGDPIQSRAFAMTTSDRGSRWDVKTIESRAPLDSGEAFFASSGSNIQYYTDYDAVAVTGGMSAHLLVQKQKIKLPLLQGKESAGANSIAVKDSNTFMIVGGDFMQKDSTTGNYCFTRDRGESWIFSENPPSGYRSCVEYLGKSNWITCGLNGVDYSTNDGTSFKKISNTGFHVCRKSKNGNKVFLAGGNGRIGLLQLP